jgi:hypothetical protein
MSERSAMFLVITGLITVMFGVGGVENSFTNVELLQSLAVSVVGLGIMGCGVLAIRVQQNG